MLSTYFGDVTSGRLQRLPFLGYFILLQVILIALLLGLAASLGVAENLIGGDIQKAQTMLREKFGIPLIIGFAIIMALFFFASLNLEAKRIRDIGLPGWWTLLAVWVISAIIIAVLSASNPELGNRISSIISTVGFLALVLIPGDTFISDKSQL